MIFPAQNREFRLLFASWLRAFLADVRNRIEAGRGIEDERDFISKIPVDSFLGPNEIASLEESFGIFTKGLPDEVRKIYVALNQMRSVFHFSRRADSIIVYTLDGRVTEWSSNEGVWHVRDSAG